MHLDFQNQEYKNIRKGPGFPPADPGWEETPVGESILPILPNRYIRYNWNNSYFYIFFQIRYRKIPILKKPQIKGQKLFVNDISSV